MLQTLQLTNFKNYEATTLQLSPHLNCFVGQNGMGKTNLLDAIYYLCMCKSHFGATDRNLMRHETVFFRLDGYFLLHDKLQKIVAKIQAPKRKTFECNKVPYQRLSEHIGKFPVVMIAPDDTLMATEGSEVRRRFLDNTLCQLDSEYLEQLMIYNKILAQRNKLLKQFAESRISDDVLLSIYDQQLLSPAAYIHGKRQQFFLDFAPIFEDYYAQISGRREAVTCDYQSKLNDTPLSALLADSNDRDRALQRTTAGIHRDDLKFLLDGFLLKQFASQGQLKSYILALKLAQFELLRQQKGYTPILLLDDIFDKLDENRVRQLLALLIERQAFGQIFITDTHPKRIGNIVKQFQTDFKIFNVENGTCLAVD